MTGLPARNEAAEYYFTYIDRITSDNIVNVLEAQIDESMALLRRISEQKSLHRYATDKWSIRQVLNHVNDAERAFAFRALWFARGFDSPLPGFDQNISSAGARADEFSWASHVEDFRRIRLATLSFFRNLPEEAWMRGGVASGNSFTVRALAYIIAGHVTHHLAIIQKRYL